MYVSRARGEAARARAVTPGPITLDEVGQATKELMLLLQKKTRQEEKQATNTELRSFLEDPSVRTTVAEDALNLDRTTIASLR